jgi:hypothetical protein
MCTVRTLAAPEEDPMTTGAFAEGLAAGPASVFWTVRGKNVIMEVPKDGSSGATIAHEQDLQPHGMAAEGDRLAWTKGSAPDTATAADGAIVESVDGGAPVDVATMQEWPARVALHDGTLFWVGLDGTLKSSASGALGAGVSGGLASDIAADDSGVYFSAASSVYGFAFDAASPAVVTLTSTDAASAIHPAELRTFGGDVYYLLRPNNSFLVPNGLGVMRVSAAGGDGTLLLPENDWVMGLWVDESGIYYGNRGTSELMHAGFGGERRTLAELDSPILFIVGDDEFLYFVTQAAEVQRVAK